MRSIAISTILLSYLGGRIIQSLANSYSLIFTKCSGWWFQNVFSSLPQGDSWSMLGMSALLLPAGLALQQEFGRVTQVLYADDRNFAVDNAHH